MKGIILAAGMGTRISRFIEEKPKSMVDIGGITLLQYTINLLKSRRIEDISICVGYKADYIRSVIEDDAVKYIYNPFYDVTNGIASMWFAKDLLNEEDTIVMSGDLYIEPAILDELIGEQKSPVLLVDSTRIVDADYRFHFENGILMRHGKDLSIADTTGENLGMAKLSADFIPVYREHMIDMINHQKHSVWWESVMYDMLPELNIYVHDIAGKFWAEVDMIEDYRRILRHRNVTNRGSDK